MKALDHLRRIEFEIRIFISLGIVLTVILLSFFVFEHDPTNMEWLGDKLGISRSTSHQIGFGLVAILMVFASLLRMWAGSVLSSPRVMSFKIRKEALMTDGPYQLSRNPIYLADLLCFCGFAFCFPLVGIAMPVLLFLHYTQLIIYEEKNLEVQFGEAFRAYKKQVPRFLPNLQSLARMGTILKSFYINKDGFRHNAQYVLLVPGFIVAATTGNILHAILIGVPGVLDWAIVHTRIGLKPKVDKPADPLLRDKVFQDIIYAQCWEDPQMDRQAFRIGPDDVVFSITSGGCNTLAFLADNPKKMYALDLSPYQNYQLELKMAAFAVLDYQEMLAFLGVLPSNDRLATYDRLKGLLKPNSRDYWDDQREKIEKGIIHCGRYEWYMRLLRRVLVFLVGKKLPEELFACHTRAARQQFFDARWDNLRWRFFTKICLSRKVMTVLFTKAFFEQLEGDFSFGDHFRRQTKKALVDLPLQSNYFLAYILFGRFYDLENLPEYLQKKNFEAIRSRLDRIEMVTGLCGPFFNSLPPESISRFSFSNIFEWMAPDAFKKLLQETIRVARDGSILTYRNLLVPRSRPATLAAWIQPDETLAAELLREDRSFIYRAYHVEHITRSHEIPNQSRS